jgi:MoaE-MoaD fusion protein
MRITARTFASLRELSVDRCDLELGPDATVDDAWSALQARFPAVGPQRPYVRAARNGAYVSWSEAVADGDVVAFLPPVSGGAASLTDAPIDVAALERSVAGSGMGAIVTFVGRARDVADDGRTVIELEYEAYPEMAEAVLDEIRAEAEQRFGVACAAVHRSGLVPIGEAAVAIVTAARHRAGAYEANRFVIEAIKERLPIWKRERFADGSEWKRPGA